MRPGLSVRGLHAGHGAGDVLRGVDLDVEPGSVLLLTGANGAGKSTFVGTLTGAVAVRAGSLLLDGDDLAAVPPRRRLLGHLDWVPEGRRLFPGLSVRENLRVAAAARGIPRHDRGARVTEALDRFPALAGRAAQPVGTLSGGQQQLVAVARALLTRPRLLLMDEPSTGLAPGTWLGVLEEVRGLAGGGTAVLLVEQRVYDTLWAVDAVAVLRRGQIVQQGPPELLADPGSGWIDDYLSLEETP